jgi:hypothetical protein
MWQMRLNSMHEHAHDEHRQRHYRLPNPQAEFQADR